MALLKSLIQRLLDSRTTPAQAGHASKPGSAVPVDYNPSASVDNWGPVLSNSTAVSDGYIWATGHTTSDKGFFQIKTQALQITTTGTSNPGGEILNLFTPVSKGQLFSVYGRYLEQVTVRLVKTIGGGYNNFIRRALSCLRPSFNCLPRSFCKAKSLGLQNNQLLLSIRALIFLAQAPLISLPTPLRATAGRLLGAFQLQSQLLKSKSRTGRWHLLPYLTETLRELESVVTLKKGHRLISCAVAEVQPIILFGSTKQVQTFNPLTGGALC